MKDHSGCSSSCFLAWRSCSEHTNTRGNEKGKGRVESCISPLEVCFSRRQGLMQEGLRKTTRVESGAGSEREGSECLEHKKSENPSST